MCLEGWLETQLRVPECDGEALRALPESLGEAIKGVSTEE